MYKRRKHVIGPSNLTIAVRRAYYMFEYVHKKSIASLRCKAYDTLRQASVIS
jgi:hypothetical protein